MVLRPGRTVRRGLALAAAVAVTATAGVAVPDHLRGRPDRPPSPRPAVSERITATLNELPLAFEANVGQTDPRVRFVARAPGYTVFLLPDETRLALRPGAPEQAAVRLAPIGADPAAQAVGLEPLEGRVNYLTGRNAEGWRTGVATYAKVAQRGVYPGIDIVYYGRRGQLEYDVVVAAGADAGAVRLAIDGGRHMRVTEAGELLIDTPAGTLTQRRPVAYQDIGGERRAVDADFDVVDQNQVGFRLGPYDRRHPLTVDPVLSLSTYLGGTGWDIGRAVAVDPSGATYVTGSTWSLDFPVTPGAIDPTYNSTFEDVFVAKLNSAGSALVYATYLGGVGQSDVGHSIAVDGSGSAYVSGGTGSSDFPTTPGAFDTSHNGGGDVFVAKLDPAGSALVYSTFVGGAGNESGAWVAVDASGAAYVAGDTSSPDFPATPGAFDTSREGERDAFAAKLHPAGSSLMYSTFLGGNQSEQSHTIDLDATGAAYVAGNTSSPDFPTTPGAFDTTLNDGDAFVAKLNPAGSALVYGTYLPGATAKDIAVDITGAAYVTGDTYSGLATTPGAFDREPNAWFNFSRGDVFVAKLNPAGSALVYGTYLGGGRLDNAHRIAVDAAGAAHVVGVTMSSDFPVTPGAFDTSYNGGSFDTAEVGDAFVTKLDPTGSFLASSTFLGGAGDDAGWAIALDAAGVPYVTGTSDSSDFPTTAGALDTSYNGGRDAFVARVPAEATPSLLSVQNPFTVWATRVNPTPLDGLGTWVATANDPVAGAGQQAPAYLYALGFGFPGVASGLVGLGVGPAGKFAAFTVSEAGGNTHTAVIPFEWTANRFYFPFVYRLGEGLWGAWVFDHAANTWVPIGALALPASWGRLDPVSITAAVWVGPPVPQCSSLPLADVFFFQPIGYVGTAPTYMGSIDPAGVTPGNCASQTTVESEGLVRNRVGTG